MARLEVYVLIDQLHEARTLVMMPCIAVRCDTVRSLVELFGAEPAGQLRVTRDCFVQVPRGSLEL